MYADDVPSMMFTRLYFVTNLGLVFRVAHDSAKAMRIWSGEAKKK